MLRKLPPFQYPITFLPMNDKAETIKFYSTFLKLPVALDQGPCILFKIGSAYWGFCSHLRETISNPGQIVLTLVVESEEDVKSWYNYLMEMNIFCLQSPAPNAKYGIFNSFYEDPNGYKLEIQSFDLGKSPI